MSIINTTKPAASLSNITRVNIGVTWVADLNTWAQETRAWAATISTMGNLSKASASITNIAKVT